MSQTNLSLFSDKGIQERFERFDRENPGVYRLLVKFARQVKAAGRDRYSIESLFGRLRWHYEVEVKTEEPFKLNDHFTSRFARKIMANEPDLKDFFETRTLKAV